MLSREAPFGIAGAEFNMPFIITVIIFQFVFSVIISSFTLSYNCS